MRAIINPFHQTINTMFTLLMHRNIRTQGTVSYDTVCSRTPVVKTAGEILE